MSKLRKGKQTRENHPRWNGGRKSHDGYTLFLVPKGCKFFCMTDGYGYIYLHRLIMAEHLQRPLNDKEVVHHINGNLDNNELDNLILFENTGEHSRLHGLQRGGLNPRKERLNAYKRY